MSDGAPLSGAVGHTFIQSQALSACSIILSEPAEVEPAREEAHPDDPPVARLRESEPSGKAVSIDRRDGVDRESHYTCEERIVVVLRSGMSDRLATGERRGRCTLKKPIYSFETARSRPFLYARRVS